MNYIFTHQDLETDIESYGVVNASSTTEAKAKAYVAVDEWTPGSITCVQECTDKELAVLNKFGVLN